MSRYFSIYFPITGVKKIVRYTKDFVKKTEVRLLISRFYRNGVISLL